MLNINKLKRECEVSRATVYKYLRLLMIKEGLPH